MELGPPPLVVAFELSDRRKSIVADELAGQALLAYFGDKTLVDPIGGGAADSVRLAVP